MFTQTIKFPSINGETLSPKMAIFTSVQGINSLNFNSK